MIVGEMNSKDRLLGIHPGMKQAFDFLEQCFAGEMEPRRYEIDGEKLYAMVFRYTPQEKEYPQYETHDKYLDIQYMVSGSEFQWYIPRKKLPANAPYQAEKDITFYPFAGEGSRLALGPGDFAIYFPEDGHLPAMPDGMADECVRIVVKIKC